MDAGSLALALRYRGVTGEQRNKAIGSIKLKEKKVLAEEALLIIIND